MVDIINIVDGDVHWGDAMRANLNALAEGVDEANLTAALALEEASSGGGGSGGSGVDQTARDAAAAAQVTADQAQDAAESAQGSATSAQNAAQQAQASADSKYTLPSGGIPSTSFDTNTQRQLVYSTPPRASVTYKRAPAGYYYAVTRVFTDGRFIPGLVDKRYGKDFDVTNPTSTGTAFKPPGERLDAYARRTGYNIVTNASGWNVTSSFGEMRGVQIRNNKLYHDFERKDLNGSPAGIEAIGVLPDGRLKCYSAMRGDTGAKMIAEGVVHAWSYGPNLVVNGVRQDIDGKNWQYFKTEISCRMIIGQSQTGDIILIATVGKTNQVGITGNDMVDLAVLEGCYNASTFDGGGSTQMYVDGFYTIPSSDDSTGYDKTVGRRSVGDVFMVNANVSTPSVDTGWINLPLRSGFAAYVSNQVPQIRQIDGGVYFRGQIKQTSGNFGTETQAFADLPPQFRTDNTAVKAYEVVGNGDYVRKVTINGDFSLSVVGSSVGTPGYLALDPLFYTIDTIF